jgi:hypothetical protein
MPIEPSKLQQILDSVDRLLADNKEKLRTDFHNRDRDITNPLDAPPQMPFSDSPPGKIHGEGKQDQELWPLKPRVPIPIETL